METQEIKQRIKDYFVEIKEDKFTKVKSIKCKHKIEWKGNELENKFMPTKNSFSNELKMGIDYRHKDEVDSVFFSFIYSNIDDGFPEMTNIKIYLILDDDKTIELSDGSGFDHTSQSNQVGDKYINVYIETAQLSVGMSDFIAIANANKIEYSIRFGQGSIESSFQSNELSILKGFYNSAFDNEFSLERLQLFIGSTGYFLNEERFNKYLYDSISTISLIKENKGLFGSWPEGTTNQIAFEDLIVGFKTNPQSKAPHILIFPNAIVLNETTDLLQINYVDIERIETKEEMMSTTIKIEINNTFHNIKILSNDAFAKYIAAFLEMQIGANLKVVNYIDRTNNENKSSSSVKPTLIEKYNLNEVDLSRLKEIENEKASLGLFSLKKEKLKAEALKILKPYDVKFMDLGVLLNEIKNQ